jgi:hypothetical protein
VASQNNRTAPTATDPIHSPRTARRKKLEDDGEMEDLVADMGYM